MCGIAGIYSFSGQPDEGMARTVRAMSDTLHHRGPDDSGIWVDADSGIALGHRRLSILDLSPLGRQPMHSQCGRYVVTYNGEVYNHLELRKELDGFSFKSTSDTETILAAISAWGLKEAVSRFVGMFAIGLWDKEVRSLSLVRDRLGIKPLYYGQAGDALVFGSELKALRAHPEFRSSIDRDALSLFFRHNYIPAPYSIYGAAKKLDPGTIAVFENGVTDPTLSTYWSAQEVWKYGLDNPFDGSENEAVDELERVLGQAVSRRMLSDVPLGAFLSGGIDSTTVVALMQAHSDRPVRTFSIGFHEKAYNEAEHAKVVAQHLGTEHTELYVTPKDLLDVVPSIPRYWDEPFADSSQIPTYILSSLTREHVTVSLSGDGGDELFSGYQRYFWMDRWKELARIPRPLRSVIGQGLKAIPAWCFDLVGPVGRKIRWRLDLLGMKDFSEFYRYFVSHFKRPDELVLGSTEPATALTRKENLITSDRFVQMALWDILSYLPDDILTKVDRASMGVALEARVPLLDHQVVEFAAKIPMSMKVRGDKGKWLLRQLLYRHVPKECVERPKMGFGVPVEQWMRTELREWCEDLLNLDVIRGQGYLDADMVGRMWNEYLAGESNWNYYLWDVLMFQAWLEQGGDK